MSEKHPYKLRNNLHQTLSLRVDGKDVMIKPLQWFKANELSNQIQNLINWGHIRKVNEKPAKVVAPLVKKGGK